MNDRRHPSSKAFRNVLWTYETLERTFAEHQDSLLGMLYCMAGDREDAQAGVQEVFANCCRRLESGVQVEDLSDCIFRIALNAGRDLRASARRRGRALTDPTGDPLNPDEQLARAFRTIAGLSADAQEVFLLRENGRLDDERISRVVDAPPDKVRLRIREALRQLMEVIGTGSDDPAEQQRARQFLELTYGLTTKEEAAVLRNSLATDPAAVRAYAEAQSLARLFSRASRVEAPRIMLERPAVSQSAPKEAKPARSASPVRSASRRLTRGADWSVVVISLLLLGISVGGYFYHRAQLADIAAESLRVMVVGPNRLLEGVSPEYAVTTTTVTGTPAPVRIEFFFQPPAGDRLAHLQTTDERGRLRVTVPADRVVPGVARLEIYVRGPNQRRLEYLKTGIPIEANEWTTRLQLDRALFRPGETVRYRALTLSRFRLLPGPPSVVHFEVRDPSDKAISGSEVASVEQDGVASGAFRLPASSPLGKYTVIARREGSPREARQTFSIAHPPAKEPAKRAPSSSDLIDVRFYPEGGELVADMENRVYFAARDPRGRPVDITGRVQDSRGRNLRRIESTYGGMGTFAFQPQAGEQYRLKIERPAGAVDGLPLPEATTRNLIVLTTGLGVVEAGQPLDFNVRAAEGGIPLVASACCRGVMAGQQPLVAKLQANSVSIALPEQALGAMRLAVHDYRFNPPRLVADRLVYRHPARRLQIALGEKAAYLAGRPAELSIVVRDEAGHPAQALLAVSLAESTSDGRKRTLPMQFLLESDVDLPEDFPLTDLSSSEASRAATVLDLLLGTREHHPKSARPECPAPAVSDNLTELQARYQGSLASYRANRTNLLDTLTVISFFGGAGLVLLVAMLHLLGITAGIRLWTLSIAVAAVCLILGGILMNPEKLKAPSEVAIAFSPSGFAADADQAHAANTASPQTSLAKPKSGDANASRTAEYAHRASEATPSATIYWHPALKTDSQGKATLRFDWPKRGTPLRLQVDAHTADGRLGSLIAELAP